MTYFKNNIQVRQWQENSNFFPAASKGNIKNKNVRNKMKTMSRTGWSVILI